MDETRRLRQAAYRQKMLDSIIGTGPFFCRDCGSELQESNHLGADFFMCPNAGEFTPGHWQRIEKDGTSYWTRPDLSAAELAEERRHFAASRSAHQRSGPTLRPTGSD